QDVVLAFGAVVQVETEPDPVGAGGVIAAGRGHVGVRRAGVHRLAGDAGAGGGGAAMGAHGRGVPDGRAGRAAGDGPVVQVARLEVVAQQHVRRAEDEVVRLRVG